MKLKIAVSGAHGTGKTTLCENLQMRFMDTSSLEICREVPRVIIETVEDQEFFRRENNTVVRQFLIFLYQMEEERTRGLSTHVLLCDRTPVDHLAYTLLNHPDFSETPECRALEKIISVWLSTFDQIFKVPIEFEVKDDGVREAASEFQKEIDRTIDHLYQKFDIRPSVVSGSVEDRARPIADLIANSLAD